MLDREQIQKSESSINEAKRRVDITCAGRTQSGKARAEWSIACADWHAQKHPVDFLWSSSYLQKLRNSDNEAISDAILYLECDPWYFRSGYLKAKLVQALKSVKLSNRDRSRLRHVIVNVASGKNRCEFRKYCSLARVVGDTDFIQLIASKIESSQAPAKGKFVFLFEYLR